jgi:hypothetical protein
MTAPGARALAGGLLAAAAVLAVLAPLPDQRPPRRGQYHVLAADLHVHSFLGDGALAPWALAAEARRRGIHVFAVTNHNQTWAARLARWTSRRLGGPLVLVGQEVTNPRYHIAAVGLEQTVDRPLASGSWTAARSQHALLRDRGFSIHRRLPAPHRGHRRGGGGRPPKAAPLLGAPPALSLRPWGGSARAARAAPRGVAPATRRGGCRCGRSRRCSGRCSPCG